MSESLAGQVGLALHEKSWFARLIRRVTHSPASHAVIAISDTLLVSADSKGVTLHRIDQAPWELVWSHFGLSTPQQIAVAKWCMLRVGRPYSWLDDFLVGVEYLSNFRWPKWVRDYMCRDKEYMCSQLVCTALAQIGIVPVPDKDPCETAPGDLEVYFLEQGWR